MRHLKEALKFLSLVDASGNISITNLVVVVLMARMGDWPTAAALLFALLNYMHQRHEAAKDARAKAELAKFDAISFSVVKLDEKLAEFDRGYAVVAKQAEETKKLLSQSNVNHAFGANRRTRQEAV